jgi:hypothetical protein
MCILYYIKDHMSEIYKPTIYKLPPIKEDDIFKYDETAKLSSNISHPKFSLGFQHFIHQSLGKMDITKEFKGKKKVYYVLSQFERNVDDYENDINNISKKYFSENPDILDTSFYKLWELFFMFPIIDIDKSNFVSVHLDDNTGGQLQATLSFRDKFTKKGLSKNDKYYSMLSDIDVETKKQLNDKLFDYDKVKPDRIVNQKTLPKAKADLITANGKFIWKNIIIQEQEAVRLLLSQLVNALKIQEKGGNFIIKVYETFTEIMAKYIMILTSFYNEVYIVKPLMSRYSSTEKYIVCIDFKNVKDKDKKISQLNNIIVESNKHKNKNIIDFFSGIKLPDNFKSVLISSNTELANKQFIQINEMVDFINKQNYRGDEYSKRRQMQIDATKYWLETYFPEIKEFNDKKANVIKITNKIVGENGKK